MQQEEHAVYRGALLLIVFGGHADKQEPCTQEIPAREVQQSGVLLLQLCKRVRRSALDGAAYMTYIFQAGLRLRFGG